MASRPAVPMPRAGSTKRQSCWTRSATCRPTCGGSCSTAAGGGDWRVAKNAIKMARTEVRKALPMSHTGSFDVKTPADFLGQMVLPQYNDFLTNNASSRFALLCAVVAYHMYEWANPVKFSEADFKNRYPSAKAHLAEWFELARGSSMAPNTSRTRSRREHNEGSLQHIRALSLDHFT